jgi:UDP-glucose 4-epimerase
VRIVRIVDPGCEGTLRETFRGADAVVHLDWGFQPSHDPYLPRADRPRGGTRRVLEAVTAINTHIADDEVAVVAWSPCL